MRPAIPTPSRAPQGQRRRKLIITPSSPWIFSPIGLRLRRFFPPVTVDFTIVGTRMPDTLPVSDKPLLSALQTALNRQLGGEIFSITDDGVHISLVVAPPGKPAVKIDGLGKDAGGIAGNLSLEGVSPAQPLAVAAFGGFTLALTGFQLTVANGRFTDANIRGRLTLPFFADKNGAQLTLNIELSPNSNGSYTNPSAALVPVLSDAQDALTNDGLALLNYPLPASSLELQIATMQLNQ